jgi:uncharacterized protein (TIGR04222 family)
MSVEACGWLAVVDVSGFDFFAAQVATLAGSAVGWWLTRRVVLGWRARRTGGHRIAPHHLHPVELAYLTGGADHAVLVAYVGLHKRGDLVAAPAHRPVAAADSDPGDAAADDMPGDVGNVDPDATAEWEVRAGDATGTHPVETAVIKAIRDGLPLPGSLLRLRLSEVMGSLHERLATQGLVVDDRLRRQVRLTGLWFAPSTVVALGGFLGAQGLRRDSLAYFGFFAVFVVAGGLGLSTYVVPRTTPAGSRVVAQARKLHLGRATDLGHDPRAVAALGPARTWKIARQVPTGFGFPRPKDPRP